MIIAYVEKEKLLNFLEMQNEGRSVSLDISSYAQFEGKKEAELHIEVKFKWKDS